MSAEDYSLATSTPKKRQCKQQKLASSDASASNSLQNFPFLDLPLNVMCDVLSRLPLKDILRCKNASKMFLEVIKDPYFISLHLARAPISSTHLILPFNIGRHGALHFFKLDLDESGSFFSSSSGDEDDDKKSGIRLYKGLGSLRRHTSDFTFKAKSQRVYLVGSCNGILCLYFDAKYASKAKPFYGIYNILLHESYKLPDISVPNPHIYTRVCRSGFGYCPGTKQYKVVRFMIPRDPKLLTPNCSRSIAMEIHTVGSTTWRMIENVPNLKWDSFDPFLNGALHWINSSNKASELISTFNLEHEIFLFTPTPPHFTQNYVDKITWINTGVLRDCLCLCYTYMDFEFEVWSMREYGVGESWAKEFTIQFSFYCNLRVKDLQRPIKFLSNGELLFKSTSACLVAFSPSKKTFRELRSMNWGSSITAHNLGFTSIKDIAGVRKEKVKSFELVRSKRDV